MYFFWHYRLQQKRHAASLCNNILPINMLLQQRFQNHPDKQNKSSSFSPHARLHLSIEYPFRAWCKEAIKHLHLTSFPRSSASTLFCFPVRFEYFPCQQAQTLLIQEECISKEASNGNSWLQTLPWGGEENHISECGNNEKKNNYCHLELNKRSFQFDDPNEELKTFVRMFQVLS